MLGIDHAPVDVIDVCEASLRFVRGAAGAKNINLTVDYQCPDTSTLTGDARRTKQILVNLLSNAVKFTPSGGSVSLTATLSAEQKLIEFHIADTGIGIAEELQGKLFKPFVQVDGRLSREYGGTGLGLALVKQLAVLQGGAVRLKSKLGQGSTFTVSFPLDKRTPAKAVEPKTKAAKAGCSIQGKPRILVAEDHEPNTEVLRSYFKTQSCEPSFVVDGVEVVNAATDQPPDVIIMDVQMPRRDGIEATKLLRLDPRTAHVPIICLTALAMSGDRQRCLEAGASEYLCKPVDLSALADAINRLVSAPQR
jgi:CheY-like chemotaxis protein